MSLPVLVQYAHPWPSRSRANAALIRALESLDFVYINDLYQRYPELHINVQREQTLLESAELVLFVFPTYWYSTPAILKLWQDTVLEVGFAYGPGGTALAGKQLLIATTTGGNVNSYSKSGRHGHELHTLMLPLRQTARFCAMHWLEPFVIYGVSSYSNADIAAQANRLRDRVATWHQQHTAS